MSEYMEFGVRAKDEATDVLKKVQGSIDDTSKAVKSSGEKIKQRGEKNQATFQSMRNYGAIAVGALSMIAKSTLNVAGKFQKYDTVLTNTLQSQEKAKEAMDMIVEVASKTPFTIDGLTQSYISLANRGIKPTRDEIVKLGDLASSQGKDFDQLVEAMLDAQTGEFERLKEFGIRANKHGDMVSMTFKGVTTEVKMTDEAMKNYIYSLGDLQGVAGGMAGISKTWEGAMSNLEDSLTGVQRRIGDALLPVMQPLITKITEAALAFASWAEKNPELVKNILLATGAVAGIVTVLGILGTVIPAVVAGISAIGTVITIMSGPVGILIALMGVLVYVVVRNWDEIKAAFQGFVDWINPRWQPFREGLKIVLEAIWEGIKTYLKINFLIIKTMVQVFGDLVSGHFESARDRIKGVFAKGMDWIKNTFGDLINQALARGGNLIDMFIKGIQGKISDLGSALKRVADKIAGYLGFHSPTKEGPASDSDTWAPNFINMFSAGLNTGVGQIQTAIAGIPTTMQAVITGGVPSASGTSSIITNNTTKSTGGVNINIGNLYGTDKETAVRFANDIVSQFKGQFMFESF